MARTLVVIFCVGLFCVTTLTDAGLDLQSLKYSSQPTFTTSSCSYGIPHRSASPYLNVSPHLYLSPVIPSKDVDYVPESDEITEKSSVVLHKVHRKNDDEERRAQEAEEYLIYDEYDDGSVEIYFISGEVEDTLSNEEYYYPVTNEEVIEEDYLATADVVSDEDQEESTEIEDIKSDEQTEEDESII